MRRRCFLTLGLALWMAMLLACGEPVTAQDKFKTNLKLAERGHAGAQYNLGITYYIGEGVPQDYAEARKWYLKAAEQGVGGS